MTFVNAIINASADLNARIVIRNDLFYFNLEGLFRVCARAYLCLPPVAALDPATQLTSDIPSPLLARTQTLDALGNPIITKLIRRFENEREEDFREIKEQLEVIGEDFRCEAAPPPLPVRGPASPSS